MDIGPDQSKIPFDMVSESYADDDNFTPTSSVFGDQDNREIGESRVLRTGHTYIIQSVECGRQLTLRQGEVILARRGTLGSAYWTCVESDGWLGFRNFASNNHLRHGGGQPGLHCSNPKLGLWERIQIRPHESTEGHTLLIEYWGGLRPIGLTRQQGREEMNRLIEPGKPSLAWRFIEVREIDAALSA